MSTNQRAEGVAVARDHKPDPTRCGSGWRVHCSCGWKGPQVGLPGQGHKPWVEHFEEVCAFCAGRSTAAHDRTPMRRVEAGWVCGICGETEADRGEHR